MKFSLKFGGETIIIPVFKKNVYFHEVLNYLLDEGIFDPEYGEYYIDINRDGHNYIFYGMGLLDNLSEADSRDAFFNALKITDSLESKSARLDHGACNTLLMMERMQAIIEGFLSASYKFNKYSKKREDFHVETVYLNIDEDPAFLESIVTETKNVIESQFFARDLANEPSNVMTPTRLAEIAEETLKPLGVNVKVYGREEIEEMGLNAFLAVANGSDEEPKFIVMEYMNGGDSPVTALVGKGITYDSGGYSIKPSDSMKTMHTDMSGAASVIATLKAVAENNVKTNVVGLIGACENSINGKAYKPGDILNTLSGKTIEVINTDAEGRITLADILYYAADVLDVDEIIDIATLTGASIYTVSDLAAASFTNNEEFYENFETAANASNERFYRLPYYKEMDDYIKGTRGDLINSTMKLPGTASRGAGASTASLFLQEFVKDKPWIHLDIAGVSYLNKPHGQLPEGATGYGVSTMYWYLKFKD